MQSDKLINLLDNPQQFRDTTYSPEKIAYHLERKQPTRRRIEQSPVISQKKTLDYSRIRENAKPEGGRAYLPSLFNTNPQLVRRLRQIEDPDEYHVINPRERSMTGVVVPRVDSGDQKNVVLRYKKERFEFGKVRPASVEIDYTELPEDKPTLRPQERRALFTAEMERLRAQALLRHERGQLEKRAILRRRGMESSVLSGQLAPLDETADISPAQRAFIEQVQHAEEVKQAERREKLTFFTRTTSPLVGAHAVPETVREKFSSTLRRATLEDGEPTESPHGRGRGKPPADEMSKIIASDWRRPSRRLFVPLEREEDIISHTEKPSIIWTEAEAQAQAEEEACKRSLVTPVPPDDQQQQQPEASPAAVRSVSSAATRGPGTTFGTTARFASTQPLTKTRSMKATPFAEGVQLKQYRSYNPFVAYPTSGEAPVAEKERELGGAEDAVCSAATMTILPTRQREFEEPHRTRRRHFWDKTVTSTRSYAPEGSAEDTAWSSTASASPDLRQAPRLRSLPNMLLPEEEQAAIEREHRRWRKPSPFSWTRKPGELPCT